MRQTETLHALLEPVSSESSLQVPKLHACAIAVRHIGEQLVLESMRKHLLDSFDLQIVEPSDVPQIEATKIVSTNPELVIVTAIPPGGLVQTYDWCSTLRKSGYRGQIIVAGLGKFKHHHRMLVRLRKTGANLFVTTARQLARVLQRFEAAQRAQVNSPKSSSPTIRNESEVAVGA